MLRSVSGLAAAVSVLLGVAAAVDVFAMWADAALYNHIGTLLTSGTDQVVHDAHVLDVAGKAQIGAVLITGVVFIVWFHRVRVNAEYFSQAVCTMGRGWAIGAWFVPVGNLWLPYRVAKEVWDASAQSTPDGSWRHVSKAPVTAWWTLTIASSIVARVGSSLTRSATTVDGLRHSVALTGLGDLLNTVAAVLAIVFVRKLTRMQQAPHTALPEALT
ncbi:hypothetical protein SCATT_04910 [Streptantibioticus cattleyicolor NRRL 8057 = DSM 46488]|uniref:DUF4328 domain-containing protein n=1 Tax=Streptantibioticus cattleyicolor (strain ATCC 35852 / DSM 46488 / JCM 4925 / NBRC 14057 / NRRL 8057) TaxID=1003195 RepID=G8WPS3_STREN|nr:hypothetical protein SCATT_04910 [Streptantibioticus cattleyicolor NRRL 8057 = DSM 46488]